MPLDLILGLALRLVVVLALGLVIVWWLLLALPALPDEDVQR